MKEAERLILETDYFECHCTVHISVPGDACWLHGMARLPHGVLPTGPVAPEPEDVLSINRNKKKKDVAEERQEAKEAR